MRPKGLCATLQAFSLALSFLPVCVSGLPHLLRPDQQLRQKVGEAGRLPLRPWRGARHGLIGLGAGASLLAGALFLWSAF